MLNQKQKEYIKEFIKGCYVINLPHRKDRLSNVCKELTKLDIGETQYNSGYLKYIEGIKFPGNHYTIGRAGCSASHCKAITYAFENNLDRIMVIEDDCVFIEEKLESLYLAVKDLQNINFDICHFGARIKAPMQNFSNGLYRMSNFGCGTAILYNKKVIPYLLNLLPRYDSGFDFWMDFVLKHECYDVWLPKIIGQNADFFALHSKELVCTQYKNFSDINLQEAYGGDIILQEFEKYRS